MNDVDIQKKCLGWLCTMTEKLVGDVRISEPAVQEQVRRNIETIMTLCDRLVPLVNNNAGTTKAFSLENMKLPDHIVIDHGE